MKKIIVYLFILVSLVPCYAQYDLKGKQDISISAGLLPTTDGRMFADILVMIITLGLIMPEDMSAYGAYSLEYAYHTSDNIAWGLVAGYSANKSTYKSGYENINYRRESFRQYYFVMPTLRYTWLQKERINFYSSIGVGLCLRNEKNTPLDDDGNSITYDNDFLPAFQVTPIGFEAGGESIKFFADLGVGNKGLLHAGVRYRF